MVKNEKDRSIQSAACKEYRAGKQRKKRSVQKRCIEDIEKAYMCNNSSMWHVLDAACLDGKSCNEPNSEAFYRHFKEFSTFREDSYSNPFYEACALDILNKYNDEQNPAPIRQNLRMMC